MMIDATEVLERMQPNQKINYDYVLQQMIKQWKKDNIHPRVLLHSCCAPCSTYTLEYLTVYADVDIYFSNDNIHPRQEYERRALVQQQFVDTFNHDYHQHVRFIPAPYHPNEWVTAMTEQQLEDEPEGGKRCSACFDYRFDRVAQKAADEGYDYFASALSISPHKNSQEVNRVGLEVQLLYDIKYLPGDFKKNNGYKRSLELCDRYNIYRQCYCGCVYAAKDQDVDLKAVAKEAKAYVNEHAPIDWHIQR